jgi:TPR repeat protein
MTRTIIMRRAVGAILAMALAAPAWAGFDQGVAAYKSEDYATALRELRPLAENGDAQSQFLLGNMYREG